MADHLIARVLIVEDEYLIGLHLEELLGGMGHQVIGIATRLTEAVEFAHNAAMNFAILDINLAGAQSFPVAEVLRQRHVPFVFASAYGDDGLGNGYRKETVLRKPFEVTDIRRALAASGLPLSH